MELGIVNHDTRILPLRERDDKKSFCPQMGEPNLPIGTLCTYSLTPSGIISGSFYAANIKEAESINHFIGELYNGAITVLDTNFIIQLQERPKFNDKLVTFSVFRKNTLLSATKIEVILPEHQFTGVLIKNAIIQVDGYLYRPSVEFMEYKTMKLSIGQKVSFGIVRDPNSQCIYATNVKPI